MSVEIMFIGMINLLKLLKKVRDKRKKSKLEIENEKYDYIVLNLSNHVLSKPALEDINSWGLCKIIERKIVNVDLTSPVTYMENVINFCADTIKNLIKKEGILNNLLVGNYVFLPPGMPSIASVFNTMFHGITGHFPLCSFFYPVNDVYGVIRPFNFQNLRIKYRDYRMTESFDESHQNALLLNYSGHPLTSENIFEMNSWFGDEYITISMDIPTVDQSNPMLYMQNTIEFCDKIIKELNLNYKNFNNLLIGKYVFIPSGMTSIAFTILAMLHGITGHFPKMTFFYKKGDPYRLIKPFDFQMLRTEFREN